MARLVFLGTPDDAVPSLEALVGAGHDVALVVTRADARRGRRGAPSPSPVKARAVELGLPVTDQLDDVLDAGAELGVVVAYGRIIPARILDAIPMVNLHFSLLPRWRGAAPVERAILAGDRTTGVCVMAVEPGLDTGAVYAVRDVPIGDRTTAGELRAELAVTGSELLVACLAGGVRGLPEPVPQSGEPSYAHKLEQGDFAIDWSDTVESVDRQVRAGRAWTTFRGRRLHVLDGHPVGPPAAPGPGGGSGAAEPNAVTGESVPGPAPGTVLDGPEVVTGDGRRYRMERVQAEGRQPVEASAWWRGARAGPDEVLGPLDPAGSHPGDPAGTASRGSGVAGDAR